MNHLLNDYEIYTYQNLFNLKTKEIKRASITKEVSIGLNGKPIMKTKIAIEPDCYYEQALNEKNFRKRLKRIGLI